MTNKKSLIAIGASILIMLALTAVFFKPIVLGNKEIVQGDIEKHKGMSKEIADHRAKYGEEPLWTNSMFGGMPAYQISTLYPSNWVAKLQVGFMKIMPHPATIIFLCLIGFYFLLVSMKVDPWLALAGASVFAFSSYFIIIIQAGHNSKGYAIAYMAPVLMGVLLTFRGKMLLGAALTALALALEVQANHLQITYYLAIMLVFIGLGEAVRLFREKKTKELMQSSGLLLVAVILAILPNISNLWLTNEYGKASTRGKSELTLDAGEKTKTAGLDFEYATQWSYGKAETMTLMIPDFQGGASEAIGEYDKGAVKSIDDRQMQEAVANSAAAYFGTQPFTTGPVYVGAIVCFLFVLGMLFIRDSLKWWVLAATVLAIMLSWGSNFEGLSKFFFDVVPGYSKFRAVSMILVVAELLLPFLAILAVKDVIERRDELKAEIKKLYISFGVTGGLALLIAIMPSMFVTTVSDEESQRISEAVMAQGADQMTAMNFVSYIGEARENLVTSDAWRSFFFIFLGAGLIYAFINFSFSKYVVIGGLFVLMTVDVWSVSMRYMDEKKHYRVKSKGKTEIPMTNADKQILEDKDPSYRVLNVGNPWNDANTSYYHKSVGGYHGAKLKRIQEVYEQRMDAEIKSVTGALQKGANDSIIRAVLANQNVLNMLNTRYMIYNPDGGVLTNRYAAGNAWFVSELKWVKNADEEMKELSTFNPKRTALVDERFKEQLGGVQPQADSVSGIVLKSYEPNKLVYEANASKDQLAVFSEIYYEKGWNAYVDGKLTPHVRADYILRAMKVSAGKHTIEFKFEPEGYKKGESIALMGSIALFAFVLGAAFWTWKKGKLNQASA
jgi:hypothetical protein